MTFAVDPRANKHEIRRAVEDALRREGARRAHDAHAAQDEAGRQVRRPQAGVEEGDRAAGARARRSSSSRECEASMAVKNYKPTSPGRRGMSVVGLRRAHAQAARALAARGPHQQERRPQRARPHHDLAPRRRPQAPLPADRLPARQARHPGEGRGDRVRPEPLGATSRCSTTRTARSATSWRRNGLAVGDVVMSGPDAEIQPGQRAAAREDPARLGGPRRRAEAGQGRPAGARRRAWARS